MANALKILGQLNPTANTQGNVYVVPASTAERFKATPPGRLTAGISSEAVNAIAEKSSVAL